MANLTNKSGGWSAVRRELGAWEKPALLALLKDLYGIAGVNRDFMLARSKADVSGGAALEKYRARIINQFFPARGFGKLKLGEARKAIRDYRKAAGDITGTAAMPDTVADWLSEIAEAYCDALETIPFGVFAEQDILKNELFHLGPLICLKMRGIERTESNVNKVTEAMLSSYVASKEHIKGIFENPILAFAFAYLASHYAMGLLPEEKVSEIMQFLDLRRIEFARRIKKEIRKTAGKVARRTSVSARSRPRPETGETQEMFAWDSHPGSGEAAK